MKALLLVPFLCLGAAGQAPPPRIALFLGPPGGTGDVVLVEEPGLSAPVPVAQLAGIRLLPLDAAGRSAWTALLPDQPRLRLDVPGAARLLLPAGHGSLYRFRRDGPAGAAFGFFRVDADGGAAVVLELGGTGPGGDVDPFLARVGIDAAGAGALVGTTPAAGGDLYELDLAATAAVNRTAALAPLALAPSGGRLLPAWGAAVAQQGLVRFARAPGAAAELVPISGIAAPLWWDGGVVASADGSTAATIAGAGPALAHVICFGAAGAARAVDAAPQHLSGAGFQPDSNGGPYLALGTDGSVAAWRTVVTAGAGSREAWLGRTSFVAGQPAVQLTSDTHFVDTLDETGLIGFIAATTALLAVGELADPTVPGSTDIDGVDLYTATLNTDGTTTLANASATSGDALEPFTKGSLKTEDGLFLLAGGGALAMDGQSSLLGRLVPGATGLQPILPQTKELTRVERAGDRLLIEARHETAAVDQKLYAFDPATGAITLLGSLPSGVSVSRHATRSGGTVAFVVSYLGKEWVARGDLVALTGALATSLPLVYGPALGFTASGALALTVGAPAAPAFAPVWLAGGGVVLLPAPVVPAQVLPGAS